MLVFPFKLPPPLGTPSYPRGRVVYLFFEDGGTQNISRIKINGAAIKIIDACFVVSPRQRNTQEENNTIRKGESDSLWNDNPHL